MELSQVYLTYKHLLFSIAYRMLGSVSDAEDMVHDVIAQLNEQSIVNDIENVKAYLCKMVTNRCIDFLKSAKKKREVYVGPWLPEPLIIQDENDPLIQLIQDDTISFALLTLMENLTPIERAIFILREGFDYSYEEIREVVGKSEVNCRKILSRVKQKLQWVPTNSISSKETSQELIYRFIQASQTGKMDELIQMLAEDVVLYSDGGGKVLAALVPIVSREKVLQFMYNITKLFAKSDQQSEIQIVKINGQHGVMVLLGQKIESVIGFEIQEQIITQIYIVRNPDKLKHITVLV